jgi:ATP-dependent Clp protease ATP-binding subunit ClpC
MIYIGHIEQRVQELIKALRHLSHSCLHMDNFHTAISLGRGASYHIGIADHFAQALERGLVPLIVETTSQGAEELFQAIPAFKRLMTVFEVEALSEAEATEAILAVEHQEGGWEIGNAVWLPKLSRELAESTAMLCDQFLASVCQPAVSFLVLEQALRDAARERDLESVVQAARSGGDTRTNYQEISITESMVLAAITQMTGLSSRLIDDGQPLDPKALKQFFYDRVVGQNEAADCLVDRLMIIKAGMNDPSRPFGVFLFLGPTGTGKTELCKVLAEFVFGDRKKIIRVDMSELMDSSKIWRLIGTGDNQKSLVAEVSANPYSIILLDEFEKAHSQVWDLFLQVFDDGVLSDYSGKTADFRSTIIILTSNLGHGGHNVQPRKPLGFQATNGPETIASNLATPAKNTTALEEVFRPEFINRLDRVIWFQPLSRSSMRKILKVELKRMLKRPAFRRRQWAVEWDAPTEDLLLEKGFSPTMGARPLIRAIERYLLTPIAHRVASHQAPKGDQFLFIRREGNRLEVDFIDPDAPSVPSVTPDSLERAKLTLAGAARRAAGLGEEFYYLRDQHQRVLGQLDTSSWTSQLEKLWEQTRETEFWSQEGRFEVLGQLDLMEEMKERLASIESRISRLGEYDWKGPRSDVRSILSSIAMDLLRIDLSIDSITQQEPMEAFLTIRKSRRSQVPSPYSEKAFDKIRNMYSSWAKTRNVELYPVPIDADPADEQSWLVSGLAAAKLLHGEQGHHLWEFQKGKAAIKAMISVEVLPVHSISLNDISPEKLQAARAAGADGTRHEDDAGQSTVTRRYREHPHPLVTDLASGWSTGNLSEVLEGRFDLLCLEKT